MKAYTLRSYGSPDQLELADVPTPVPAAGEVLVRVRATSVNPYDWHGLRGEPYVARLMPGGLRLLRPPKLLILGCDMAGEVEAVGSGVTGFRPGDGVFAVLEQGGFAEYVSVPERLLARKPENLSYEQAAAVPMAGITALLAVRDVGRAEPGQRVLVNGASGGVGTFAVQIARALGAANVDAVCRAGNADLVRSIGATGVIDYPSEDFTRGGRRYDLLIDIAGSRTAVACRRVLAPKATMVIVGGPAGRWIQPVGHVVSALALGPLVSQRIAMANAVGCAKQEILTALTALIEDGAVTPVIGRTYAFTEIPEAIAYQEQGHATGKVVVTI